jgi:hypothetical protein
VVVLVPTTGAASPDCANLQVHVTPELVTSVLGENPVVTLQLKNVGSSTILLGGDDLRSTVLRINVSGPKTDSLYRNNPRTEPPLAWCALAPGATASRSIFVTAIDYFPPLMDRTDAGERQLVYKLAVWTKVGDQTRLCHLESAPIIWRMEAYAAEEKARYESAVETLRGLPLNTLESVAGRREVLEHAPAEWKPQLLAAYLTEARIVGGNNITFDGTEFQYLIDSAGRALELGPPYCDPLLNTSFIDFLGKNKQWSLLKQISQKLCAEREYRPGLDYEAVWLGGFAAFLDDPQWGVPPERRAELEESFLTCLSKGLERQDIRAASAAADLLEPLAAKGKWSNVQEVASAVLKHHPEHVKAQAAKQQAAAHLGAE